MSLGFIALLFAVGAAGWLLRRLATGHDGEERNVTLLKLAVWFGLAAALFAAKLWPLAFMVLIAAGGVMGIESWRRKTINEEERQARPPAPMHKAMSYDEAKAVLGITDGANEEEVKSAHKKLISQIHPDKGGTDYLAAKINEARDVLLRDQ